MRRRLAACAAGLAVALSVVGAGRLGAAEPAGGAKAAELVPASVRDVKLDPVTLSPLVVIETLKKDRVLLVAIGHPEAVAIVQALRHEAPPRPMTHDLLKDVIAQLGGKLDRIVITRLDKGVFYAELVLRRGDAVIVVDARPSDALALALRAGGELFVARSVLDEAGLRPDQLRDEPVPAPPRRPNGERNQAI